MASALRIAMVGCSALLHAGVALSFVSLDAGSRSYEAGDGSDVFQIEQGLAVEGISQLGEPAEVIQTARDNPLEAQAAVVPEPEAAEARPEVIEQSEVIASRAEVVEEQEVIRETPPEEVVKPREVVAVEPVPETVVVEEKSAAARQTGGDATIRMAYLGKLRSRIEEKKVNPNSRDAGTVVVRFTVDARGNLVSREVATSSGSKRLDEAALAAVERASPYPPFPDGIGTPTIVVNVPFRFITR